MNRSIMVCLVVLCVGCGDEFEPSDSDGGSGTDAGVEAAVAPDAACDSVSNSVACVQAIDAWCGRIFDCCSEYYDQTGCEDAFVFMGSYSESLAKCQAAYHQSDCVYVSGTVCVSELDECKDDVNYVSCGDIQTGLGHEPKSCLKPIMGK